MGLRCPNFHVEPWLCQFMLEWKRDCRCDLNSGPEQPMIFLSERGFLGEGGKFGKLGDLSQYRSWARARWELTSFGLDRSFW